MKRLLYLGIALFLIVFEAVPEGLALAGHKTIAGIIEFVFLAGITLTVFAYFTNSYFVVGLYYPTVNHIYESKYYSNSQHRFIWYVAGYVLLRLAIFDIVHNLAAGESAFFISSTKLFDIFMTKLASWGWFMRFIGGIVGITWLLKK